jgi:hypothetical protein
MVGLGRIKQTQHDPGLDVCGSPHAGPEFKLQYHQKHDPTICCLSQTHSKYDIGKLKAKGQKKMHHVMINQEKAPRMGFYNLCFKEPLR